MQFSVADDVFARFPTLCVAVLVVTLPAPVAECAAAQRRDQEARRRGLRSAQQAGHPGQTLARCQLRHQGELFAFGHVDGRAPDNNVAERAVRPVVIARKVRGGTRRPEGTTTRLTLARLCYTGLARGLNPFPACLALLRGESSLM